MAQPTGIVVIEGPNGSGKSTLAQTLVQRYGALYLHCKYRFKSKVYTYHLGALSWAQKVSKTRLVVIDRLWLSEEIYAHVYRGGSPWPHAGRLLEKVWLKNAALGVLCLSTAEHAAEMLRRRGGQYHSPELLQKPVEVVDLYQKAWSGPTINQAGYLADVCRAGGLAHRPDWVSYRIWDEGQNLITFCDDLIAKLADWRAAQHPAAFNSANLAGHAATAKFVLVGDKPNYRDWRRTWPFVAYANSSLYLTKAMSQLGLDETQFLWTNASCPESHLSALAQNWPMLKFIALGGEAAKELSRLGIACRTIAHPSYARRFQAADGVEGYAGLLKSALLGQ